MIERDFSPRDLKEAFFPVTQRPLRWVDMYNRQHPILGYKALVDDLGNHISIVSGRYKLVTNEDAYSLAKYVIKGVFQTAKLSDFKCYNIYMPTTRSSCRIDLIIPGSERNPFEGGRDTWTPFLRISNSYNHTCVLSYEVGFCRSICLNGVIFGNNGVKISFDHNSQVSQHTIAEQIVNQAYKKIGDIERLWTNVRNKLTVLRKIQVPIGMWLAVFCKIFNVRIETENISPKRLEMLIDKKESLINSAKEYAAEMGETAYGLLNMLTDYASYPVGVFAPHNYVHAYQRKVGQWADEFISASSAANFNLNKYVGLENMETAVKLKELKIEK